MKRVINGKTYSKVLGIKQGSLLTAGKDGDIEEYKADPTDAGKVLTVGEDGSISPADVGTTPKYMHCISIPLIVTGGTTFSFSFINEVSTPYPKLSSVASFFSDKEAGYTIPASGGGVYKVDENRTFHYSASYLKKETGSAGVGLYGTSGTNSETSTHTLLLANVFVYDYDINDTVFAL